MFSLLKKLPFSFKKKFKKKTAPTRNNPFLSLFKKKLKEKDRHKPSKSKKKKNSKQKNWHQKHPMLSNFFKVIFFPLTNPILRTLCFLLIVVIVGFLIHLSRQLPSPRTITVNDSYDVSTQIFDRHETLLYEIYGDINRIPINISDLPEHVLQATIAIEDKNYYRHHGVDLRGIIRAFLNNLEEDSIQQGGSTITQQLIKNALLTPERSINRKIKEATLSLMTEAVYSKKEILEMYLNYISYGGASVGIEAASQAYFNKHAKNLSLAEAALIAGLPQAPTRYSPFGSNPERAKARQAEVLRRMREDGYITALQAEEAKAEPLEYALSHTEIKAPHFVFFVRDWLYDQYGTEKVERGGLRVHTTLDLELQTRAQQIVAQEIAEIEKYRVGNGAALVIKPNTGEILAMIGSKNYFDSEQDGQVNVTIANRQPGSSIKPLVYATAFQEKTLHPGTLLLDVPTCFSNPGQKPYCPRNYDGTFRGAVTVRQSLGNSFNIPAVKAIATIGVEKFMEQARKMGITTWHDSKNYGPSLALGGGEVKMLDMAQAFGTLANQGVKVPITPILRVEDYRGKVLEEIELEQRLEALEYINTYDVGGKDELQRVMDQEPAYLVSHILQDNRAREMVFGSRSQLVIADHIVGAKTGTTNDMKDNWTVGFTPDYLVTTWVGNNDSTPMGRMVSGIMGAAPMFNKIMSMVLEGKTTIWQDKPADVVMQDVCASGMSPHYSNDNCQVKNQDLFWKKSKPANSIYRTEEMWIDPETGQPPPYGEEVHGLVLEEKTVLQDPVTSLYCLDCALEHDEKGRPIYPSQTVEL